MLSGPALIITCEHAGNRVPRRFRNCLRPQWGLLQTHRGYDLGAASLARRLARRLKAPLYEGTVTRLLVDLNRSIGNRSLFQLPTESLSQGERDNLLMQYYHPFRRAVRRRVRSSIARNRTVVHLSIHSFTPIQNGKVRDCDVGLLYDPSRVREKTLCRAWRCKLREVFPLLRVRFNGPYRGIADGHTTALRKEFPANRYLGIELEVNQKLSRSTRHTWPRIASALAAGF